MLWEQDSPKYRNALRDSGGGGSFSALEIRIERGLGATPGNMESCVPSCEDSRALNTSCTFTPSVWGLTQ